MKTKLSKLADGKKPNNEHGKVGQIKNKKQDDRWREKEVFRSLQTGHGTGQKRQYLTKCKGDDGDRE